MKKYTMFISLCLAVLGAQAQDYLISFAGTGDTTVVNTIKVDNLTSGASITLNGGDILHLKSGMGIELQDINDHYLNIQPNPMLDQAVLKFTAPGIGDIWIFIYDVSGKTVCQTHVTVLQGENCFRISGIYQGMYFVKINGDNYSYSTKLISQSNTQGGARIEYISNDINSRGNHLKSSYSIIDMPYSTGDILLYTGTAGQYGTLITDIPTGNKDITFNFVLCRDNDGYNYKTVRIGTQIWMAENLKTTKFRNGDQIPYVTEQMSWWGLTTGAYCNYDNTANYSTTFGSLYNWPAVNDIRNISPLGWHVPTDYEWSIMTAFLGTNPGNKLKEAGTEHWLIPNTGATNETGFTALPGGNRSNTGIFTQIGESGFWWCSNEQNADYAWSRFMRNILEGVNTPSTLKSNGYSVRCVYDGIFTGTVTTTAASNITTTTAISGGNVTSDGGATITARGVCWSTTQNPSIADNKTTDGQGIGNFTSNITGLIGDTTYYVRAYATNSQGTAYGNQVTFTSTPATVTDIDGNVYHTVTIGTQVWMVENLKTTKYRNGDPILHETQNSAWGALIDGAYCYYNNDENYKATYGSLYNWYTTVDIRNLAPIGWHVPTDAEWTTLTTYLGGESVAGGKLKETGTAHWQIPNSGATNSSGFTALPGGGRYNGGAFGSIGNSGCWWASTGNSSSVAWSRGLSCLDISIERTTYYNDYGFSVRCIKDSLEFSIGQSYGGGIIFYIDSTGKHGLISSISDQSTDAAWGCGGTLIGTSAAIGTGQANTIAIVDGCSQAGIAARICNLLVLNGYDDWFLPSKDELNQMYLQKELIGGFQQAAFYFSSTELDAQNAWYQDLHDGSCSTILKTYTEHVRAIRAF